VSHRTVVLELAGNHQLARDLVAGGVFVPDVLVLGEECALVLRNGDHALGLHALCVYVDAAKGSGLQLTGCDADMKQQVIALASGMAMGGGRAAEVAEPARDGIAADAHDAVDARDAAEARDADDDRDGSIDSSDAEAAGDPAEAEDAASAPERKIALNVHERLRGLTLVQQLKVAQHGEVSERIVLERLYGKNVWEALLRNPRLTGPEVARIARMGALPRPMIELIVGNGAWLQIPEVRRALLTNPRLGPDQILRVLRLLPKHELKLAGMQTAYPCPVRDAAKKLLREQS
jgi:hypothetical protein